MLPESWNVAKLKEIKGTYHFMINGCASDRSIFFSEIRCSACLSLMAFALVTTLSAQGWFRYVFHFASITSEKYPTPRVIEADS